MSSSLTISISVFLRGSILFFQGKLNQEEELLKKEDEEGDSSKKQELYDIAS